MTALAANYPRDRMGSPDQVLLPIMAAGVAASTIIYAGTLVALNASGYLISATATSGPAVGVARKLVDNSAGAAGALSAEYVQGAFTMAMATSDVTIATRFQDMYVVDNATVSGSDGGAGRPRAGYLVDVLTTTTCVVMVGVANPNAIDTSSTRASAPVAARADGVVIANVASLAAFTVANNGITHVAGNVVLLAAQTTAAENGLYTVGTVAAGVAPLTRVSYLNTGDGIPSGMIVEVGAGNTLLPNSTWKATAAAGGIIGTNDPAFYPRVVRARVTLAGGTSILAMGATQGLFLLSTTTSMVELTRVDAAGTLGTAGLRCAVATRTAGVSGTAAATVQSIDDAGTAAGADTSTVDVLVTNWG